MGELLTNNSGEVTSHLSGLFYRNVNLLAENIKLIYIFDGKPSPLKSKVIGHFSHISFPEFSRSLLPAAVMGLAINFFILRFGFRKMLRQTAIDHSAHVVPKLERGLFVLVCIVFVSIFAGFLAGLNLAWMAMAGAVLVMVLARRDTHNVLKLVDWHLLLFLLRCSSSSMG